MPEHKEIVLVDEWVTSTVCELRKKGEGLQQQWRRRIERTDGIKEETA
jgi:hypothetical protein